MRFRIGVDVGDVMVKDDDIFGNGVNVAARLEGLSREVKSAFREARATTCVIAATCFEDEDLGEQLMKNIAHPIRAFRLRIGEAAPQQEIPNAQETVVSSAPAEISKLSADNEVALELALWDSVKDRTPAELESYLEQYPEGTFASIAQTRLDAVALSRTHPPLPLPADVAADELDLAFWNSVKDSDRREELEAYLDQHPNGHFAGLARARLSSPEST